MHESALAKQILSVVLERARAEGAARVQRVKGWVAETEQLGREALAFHFEAHAKGTPAEGAELELELIEVRARCSACQSSYLPDHHVLSCPSCGSNEGELLGRTGLGVDVIEVDG